jgi:hypothetical protein
LEFVTGVHSPFTARHPPTIFIPARVDVPETCKLFETNLGRVEVELSEDATKFEAVTVSFTRTSPWTENNLLGVVVPTPTFPVFNTDILSVSFVTISSRELLEAPNHTPSILAYKLPSTLLVLSLTPREDAPFLVTSKSAVE